MRTLRYYILDLLTKRNVRMRITAPIVETRIGPNTPQFMFSPKNRNKNPPIKAPSIPAIMSPMMPQLLHFRNSAANAPAISPIRMNHRNPIFLSPSIDFVLRCYDVGKTSVDYSAFSLRYVLSIGKLQWTTLSLVKSKSYSPYIQAYTLLN